MTAYYQLIPKDCRHNNWLFHVQSGGQPLGYRAEYQALRCRRCGKLDEFAAIDRFVPADLSFRSRWSYLGLSDDFGIAVDSTFISLVAEQGIGGLRFFPLPGDRRYQLLLPTCIMPVDALTAGFQYSGQPCEVCGRYPEAVVGPLVESITKPDDPMTIFCGEQSEQQHERHQQHQEQPLASRFWSLWWLPLLLVGHFNAFSCLRGLSQGRARKSVRGIAGLARGTLALGRSQFQSDSPGCGTLVSCRGSAGSSICVLITRFPKVRKSPSC
jgi:hypothetical protein